MWFGWLLVNLGILILVPLLIVISGIVIALRKSDSIYLYLAGIGGFVMFWGIFVLSLLVWGIVLITSGF